MPETVLVPLSKGKHAIIDAADAERVLALNWYAVAHHGNFYGRRRDIETRKVVSLHRFIMGAAPGEQVDHRNGDGLDNRRANLRVCNNAQNSMNKHTHKASRSGFKGVTRPAGWPKCMAQIGFQGKRIHLGMFNTEEEAARAYDRAALELFGDFAHTNFPLLEANK